MSNTSSAKEAAAPRMAATLSPNLNVVKQSKGPVMTLADEFYKVGPGPSSSQHDRARGPSQTQPRHRTSAMQPRERG